MYNYCVSKIFTMKNEVPKLLFLDTEFTELSLGGQLISIAIVADSGEEFYAEFNDFDRDKVNSFVEDNVLSNLYLHAGNYSYEMTKLHVIGDKKTIRLLLEIWLQQFGIYNDNDGNQQPHLHFWADVSHYDWVFFCDLFGGALQLPPAIHFICRDFATWIADRGIDIATPRISLLPEAEHNMLGRPMLHNALYDAKLLALLYQKLNSHA